MPARPQTYNISILTAPVELAWMTAMGNTDKATVDNALLLRNDNLSTARTCYIQEFEKHMSQYYGQKNGNTTTKSIADKRVLQWIHPCPKRRKEYGDLLASVIAREALGA
jgi:hypothetical protein